MKENEKEDQDEIKTLRSIKNRAKIHSGNHYFA